MSAPKRPQTGLAGAIWEKTADDHCSWRLVVKDDTAGWVTVHRPDLVHAVSYNSDDAHQVWQAFTSEGEAMAWVEDLYAMRVPPASPPASPPAPPDRQLPRHGSKYARIVLEEPVALEPGDRFTVYVDSEVISWANAAHLPTSHGDLKTRFEIQVDKPINVESFSLAVIVSINEEQA